MSSSDGLAAGGEKEYTYADISAHNSKKDGFVVIHDRVYNAASFVDEHPGGEEVLLDVLGQDATEAFEDVGHSDEAREILNSLLVGRLKRLPGDPAPKVPDQGSVSMDTMAKTKQAGGGGLGGGLGGVGLYGLMLLGAVLAFGAWKFLAAGGGQKEGGVKI
ncbi:MAG: hypothetical protein M1816_004518 [Peltula sp. TS41687]|nr:MAG: hypothetical protein M1816_004518 [Peltula sp. TS41687]